MKYPNIPNINPIEINLPDYKVELDSNSEVLQQIVNFGAHLIKWIMEKIEGEDEKIPPILMLRNMLEIIDSISVLVKNSLIDPCKILLRSFIESYLYLEYLFSNNSDIKALAFIYCHYQKKIKFYKKFDLGSIENKQLHKMLKNDILYQKYDLSGPDMGKKIINLENLLNKPKYIETRKEFNRLIDKGIRNPKWYELYDGPKNVEQLSIISKQRSLYEIWYRKFSEPLHVEDIFQGKISTDQNGFLSIMQIRSGMNYSEITKISIYISIFTYDIVIKNYLPEKEIEYRNWISEEIE